MAKVTTAAKGIRQLIIGLRRVAKGKNARVARTAGKTAEKVGRSGGMLARLRDAFIISKLAGGGGNDTNQDSSSSAAVAGQNIGSGGATNTYDPTINLTPLSPAIESLTPVAERTDLTVIEETPIGVEVFPQEIVENYFDDNYAPIKVEKASIEKGTEINAISNSIGALAAQIAATNALTDSVDEAVDENRKTKRQNERRRDEEAIEKKEGPLGPGQLLGQGIDSLSEGLGELLGKLALPAIALGFANLSKEFQPDDPDATLGEVVEDNLGWLDDIENKYTQVYIGMRALGANIKQGMAQIAVNMIDKFGDWKAARIEKAMSVGPQKPGALTRLAEAVAQARAWAPKPNTKAMAVFQTVKAFLSPFEKIVKGFGRGIARTGAFIATLPKPIMALFKGFLAKPVRWMAAFYALVGIKDAALTWALQMISEEEFHQRTKANIREFCQIIGGTWIICTIFAFIGGTTGTFAVPFFGTLAGSLIGVVLGVLFGEDLWVLIGADEIVNAFYKKWVMGETWEQAFGGIGSKIIAAGKERLNMIAERYKEFFLDVGDAFGMVDRVATSEEIAEDYGEDATLVDIATESMEKINTDENAIFYVADSIRDQEHLDQVNAEMIQKHGMTLRQYAHENLKTQDERDQFDAYLERALAGKGGNGIDIRDEMREEYVVYDRDGNTVGIYENESSARQKARQSKGKLLFKQRAVYDPSLSSERHSGVETTQTELPVYTDDEYPVVNGKKEVVALFDSRQEADQYIMNNQGSGLDTLYLGRPEVLPVYTDNEMSDLNIEQDTAESVVKLQTAFSDSDPIEKFESIMSTAIEVAEDGNYEQVKKVYEESSGRSLSRDLENIVGEENAEVIETIMKGEPNQIAEVVSETAMTEMLETYMPNVSSEIKEKAAQIIPIIMNQARQQHNRSVATGAAAFGSLPDTASPNFDTSDSFMSEANFYQT